MLGMESMMASLLGVTPEQMRETINGAVELLSNLDNRLSNIEQMVAEMHSLDYPAPASGVVIEQTRIPCMEDRG